MQSQVGEAMEEAFQMAIDEAVQSTMHNQSAMAPINIIGQSMPAYQVAPQPPVLEGTVLPAPTPAMLQSSLNFPYNMPTFVPVSSSMSTIPQDHVLPTISHIAAQLPTNAPLPMMKSLLSQQNETSAISHIASQQSAHMPLPIGTSFLSQQYEIPTVSHITSQGPSDVPVTTEIGFPNQQRETPAISYIAPQLPMAMPNPNPMNTIIQEHASPANPHIAPQPSVMIGSLLNVSPAHETHPQLGLSQDTNCIQTANLMSEPEPSASHVDLSMVIQPMQADIANPLLPPPSQTDQRPMIDESNMKETSSGTQPVQSTSAIDQADCSSSDLSDISDSDIKSTAAILGIKPARRRKKHKLERDDELLNRPYEPIDGHLLTKLTSHLLSAKQESGIGDVKVAGQIISGTINNNTAAFNNSEASETLSRKKARSKKPAVEIVNYTPAESFSRKTFMSEGYMTGAVLRKPPGQPAYGNLLPLPLHFGYQWFLGLEHEFTLPYYIVEQTPGLLAYTKKPPPYFKITKNIYPKTRRLRVSQEIAQCSCRDLDESGEACGQGCFNRYVQYFCGANCPMGSQCSNQPFSQRKIEVPGEVIFAGKKGFGMRAIRDVKAGELITEYLGEVIDSAEVRRRCDDEYLNRKDFYMMQLHGNEFLDGGLKGNDARFINHACGRGANCSIQKWRINGFDEYQIGIFAKRAIPKGDEFFYDYRWEDVNAHTVSLQCFCGSEDCRGWLGGTLEQKAAQAEKAAIRAQQRAAQRLANAAADSSSSSDGNVSDPEDRVSAPSNADIAQNTPATIAFQEPQAQVPTLHESDHQQDRNIMSTKLSSQSPITQTSLISASSAATGTSNTDPQENPVEWGLAEEKLIIQAQPTMSVQISTTTLPAIGSSAVPCEGLPERDPAPIPNLTSTTLTSIAIP